LDYLMCAPFLLSRHLSSEMALLTPLFSLFSFYLISYLVKKVSWREINPRTDRGFPCPSHPFPHQKPLSEPTNHTLAGSPEYPAAAGILGQDTYPREKSLSAPTNHLARQSPNHARILRQLGRTYRELMDQSLQGAAWLELGLIYKPDAVQNATNLLWRVK